MTTKTISTYYPAGYSLASQYSFLEITATGGVGGTGLYCPGYVLATNRGTINATSGAAVGVSLSHGTVDNYGFIGGYVGVLVRTASVYTVVKNFGTISTTGEAIANATVVVNEAGATISGSEIALYNKATLVNHGTVTAFVQMSGAGQHDAVFNGDSLYTTALMNGGGGIYITGSSISGTVSNYGTIAALSSPGHNGINVGGASSSGGVLNGSAADTAARIEGYTAVLIQGTGTVTNFGTIDGLGAAGGAYGVVIGGGGSVTNGSTASTAALVEGYTGVEIKGAAGAVVNFGTIKSTGAHGYGVYLAAGGSVTNGSTASKAGLIEGGQTGVSIRGAAGTVVTFGTIKSTVGYGVLLNAGGSVTNGSAAVRAATIAGGSGLAVFGGGSVMNFGTIEGTNTSGGRGVYLYGGALTNGSVKDAKALIEGTFTGALLFGNATAANFGTIAATGAASGNGVVLNDSRLTNGSAGHATATIRGFTGVYGGYVNDTVTNFGTIAGTGGTALGFSSSTDTLIVEAGCLFGGAVFGGGGTLDLASGVGTLTGLMSAGGNVTVSGSMATTTFQNFGTVEIGAGAAFATSGAVTIAAGQAVIDAGALTLGGKKATIANAGLIETSGGVLTIQNAVANSGTLSADGGILTVDGAVTGSGQATIKSGTLDLASSFTENVTFTGKTGVLELAKSQTYGGTITGFSKTGGTSLDLLDIGFVSSSEATYSGTKTGGVLTVTDGTHTAHINLKGDYRSSTFVAASDGHGGVIVHDPPGLPPPAPPPIAPGAAPRFIAAMSGWSAGGGYLHVATAEPWRGARSTLAAPGAHPA